jgi:hypothetical protein
VSWQAVAAVLDADFPDLAPADHRRRGCSSTVLKFVCVTLAESANADGTDARDGIRRIAQRASVTLDTARIALDGLVEIGAITLRRAATGSTPARYDVALAALPTLPATEPSARPSRAVSARPSRAESARPSRALRAAQPRGSARLSRAIPSTSPVTPAEPAPVRLAAETPPPELRARVAAILAAAAAEAKRPDLFGKVARQPLDAPLDPPTQKLAR